MEQTDNEYRAQRLANLEKLRARGYKPFGQAFQRTGRLAEIRHGFQENRRVSAAGRLLTIRNMGKSIFADLRDGSDRFQIYAGAKQLAEPAFQAFRALDLGDHIGVTGSLFTTKTGEKTILVENWTLLSKALLTLPEKWHGLRDVEARYRQRYLDLIVNPAARGLFDKRIRAVHEIRRFLMERGFQEVETPMIQPQAGGAAARPFVTRHTALDADMFLRVAPELYLKRLLVGGFDKIFELNRNFRNEGLSRTHNPEFTMLEIYEAYSDARGMKELAQGLIAHVAEMVFGTLKLGATERPIDLTPPWREIAYRDLILERMGADWFDLPLTEARCRLEAQGVGADPKWNLLLLTHEAYEKLIEKTLIRPTFVTRFPADLIALAKACDDDPSRVDVFELVIAGMEVAPAYTEMNDPIAQRERFEHQAGENPEKVDEDFLTALEYGMPPAGGMGVGIDRLIMILSGQETLRDVILFPQLRPRKAGEPPEEPA
ncbi:MAG: lysine--tRNA ligase [Verrucomicrobiota bacterium]|nr:lysine--tRNA ligase [Verrucomicrobiota bacterium]